MDWTVGGGGWAWTGARKNIAFHGRGGGGGQVRAVGAVRVCGRCGRRGLRMDWNP